MMRCNPVGLHRFFKIKILCNKKENKTTNTVKGGVKCENC